MIIWINGAFGSGKTSVAEAVNKRIANSYVYDPEMAGYFLWEVFPEEMKRKGNFQHIPLWREINYKALQYIAANYAGVIIAPMTVYIRQYYDEIAGRLAGDGVEVESFILSAGKRTILGRLAARGDGPDGWAARHIDVCVSAFETDIPGRKIVTDDRGVDEIADEIVGITGQG